MSPHRAIGPDDRIRISGGVSARQFDGQWILLDLAGGNYFGLDEIGGTIWQNLSAGKSPAEIAGLLAPAYDVAEPILLRDVLRLVDELVRHGLVRISE
jgi:hypothetical protein